MRIMYHSFIKSLTYCAISSQHTKKSTSDICAQDFDAEAGHVEAGSYLVGIPRPTARVWATKLPRVDPIGGEDGGDSTWRLGEVRGDQPLLWYRLRREATGN